jgi:hypothetical protein
MEAPTDPFQKDESGGFRSRAPGKETSGLRASTNLAPPSGVEPATTGFPHWASVLLGRWILRFCPPQRKAAPICEDQRCALRIYCKCAREDSEYGAALEQRVWLVLAVCGLAVILFWILSARGVRI